MKTGIVICSQCQRAGREYIFDTYVHSDKTLTYNKYITIVVNCDNHERRDNNEN